MAVAARGRAAEPLWRQWADTAATWTAQTSGWAWRHDVTARTRGLLTAAVGACLIPAFATYDPTDPSWNASSSEPASNLLGGTGAVVADLALQSLGLGAWIAALLMLALGLHRAFDPRPSEARRVLRRRALMGVLGLMLLSAVLAAPAPPALWPLAEGLGGLLGERLLTGTTGLIALTGAPHARVAAAALFGLLALPLLAMAVGLTWRDLKPTVGTGSARRAKAQDEPDVTALAEPVKRARAAAKRQKPAPDPELDEDDDGDLPPFPEDAPAPRKLDVAMPKAPRPAAERETVKADAVPGAFVLPDLDMLTKPKPRDAVVDEAQLKANAALLESVLAEFGVRGQIDQIRPGPVVTLYELVPAPGVKSARVVALSDDIARSMSARACRVSVVAGRNAIGIELPNAKRETVYLRDLLASAEFEKGSANLPMALGENIGGEPYVADLGKMPHLLIAGTTGSGKSVGVNAMILSILYRLPPEKCRFIMIDPKMLELSVYDGIPHLLAPVVTDPKKAVVALKWTVREMEQRYRLMSKIGVRNITGYNQKCQEAIASGEHFERTVQTGFNEQGRPVYESEKIRPEPMPFIVVIIDEVADLMLVAGKDIEGAVQRLAQMARAAGIHLIMATQRPSVDVITGTIKANFPTRISFQVTSKIDSRTIMGEQGAEQLLGQGDMLYMPGGKQIARVHGPFVSDDEVRRVADHWRAQGQPDYIQAVTE